MKIFSRKKWSVSKISLSSRILSTSSHLLNHQSSVLQIKRDESKPNSQFNLIHKKTWSKEIFLKNSIFFFLQNDRHCDVEIFCKFWNLTHTVRLWYTHMNKLISHTYSNKMLLFEIYLSFSYFFKWTFEKQYWIDWDQILLNKNKKI